MRKKTRKPVKRYVIEYSIGELARAHDNARAHGHRSLHEWIIAFTTEKQQPKNTTK